METGVNNKSQAETGRPGNWWGAQGERGLTAGGLLCTPHGWLHWHEMREAGRVLATQGPPHVRPAGWEVGGWVMKWAVMHPRGSGGGGN